jgi:hypothetical protein
MRLIEEEIAEAKKMEGDSLRGQRFLESHRIESTILLDWKSPCSAVQ